MRWFLLALPVTALSFAVPARADDPASALDRLSEEVADLASRADGAAGWLETDAGWLPGVFVGSPAHFVVAADGLPDAAKAKVRLPDGSEVEAVRLDADQDLGVVVYDVPGAKVAGLAAESTWSARRGTLGVVSGRDPDILFLRGSSALRENLRIATTADGAALVGSGGRLLGLRVWSVSYGSRTFGNPAPLTYLFTGQDWRTWTPAMPRFELSPGEYTALTEYAGRRNAATIATTDVRQVYVPGPVVARVLEDVAAGGRIRRPYLGVVLDESRRAPGPSPTDVPTLGPVFARAGREPGVRISAVLPKSPAAAAGIEAGQTITAIDGETCADPSAFSRALARRRPGETIRLAVAPGAKEASVTLVDREEAKGALRTAASVGLECLSMTPEIAKFLGLASDAVGVVVRSTLGDHAAAQAGLAHGDVIFQGGGGPIRDVDELDAVLAAAKGTITLSVNRGGEIRTIELSLQPTTPGRKAR